jgi:hypothetical protein
MRKFTQLIVGGIAAGTLLLGVAAPASAAAPRQDAAAAAAYASSCNISDTSGRYQGTIHGVSAWLIYRSYFVQGQYCQIGKAKLFYQPDGNLVVYDETGKARWAVSWYAPDWRQSSFVDFQDYDGNFVMYYSGGSEAIWASNTCCRTGAELAVQSDGNVVIYDSAVRAVWSTRTSH